MRLQSEVTNKFMNFAAKVAEMVRLGIHADTIRANMLTGGEIFLLLEDSDTDFNLIQQRFGTLKVFTTLAEVNAAVTTNRNDVVLMSAVNEHSTAMVTISKNRVHFQSLDGANGRKNSQGTKVATPATDVAASVAVVSNTGTRNTFRNIKFIQQGTNVAQTSGFIDTGEGTYCEGCEFEVNSILTTVTQGLLFKGDTCHYKNCQFGNSTVYHTAANQAPLVIQTPARYSYFENCTMINYSDKTSASCIDAPDTDSVIGWIKFENCSLVCANLGNGATAGATIAEGVTNAGTSGYLMFDNRCTSYNCGKFAETVAYTLNAAPAGAATAGGGKAVAGA